MNFRALVAAGALGIAALVPSASMAGSITGVFGVDATVPPNCTIVAPGGFHFGTYDPLVTNFTTGIGPTYAAFFMKCTLGTVPTIGTVSTPAMSDGVPSDPTLAYTLTYGSGLSAPYGINNTKAINFVGSIAPGQDVPVGSYSATATVTVNF